VDVIFFLTTARDVEVKRNTHTAALDFPRYVEFYLDLELTMFPGLLHYLS
jgi:hypothetical protein